MKKILCLLMILIAISFICSVSTSEKTELNKSSKTASVQDNNSNAPKKKTYFSREK